mmetsp:Transcript_9486/g.16167  ORF Transcript_9486/g.16167 Transcript_9486/m.16167 type:complete len:309 (-) Transcript_9486:246-1172(-)
MMMKFGRALLLSILSATCTWLVAAENADPVPGCNCGGTVCLETYEGINIEACSFVTPSVYSSIRNQSTPVCDALLANLTFVDYYGDKISNPNLISVSRGGRFVGGPYYSGGSAAVYRYKGTCAQVYEKQNSCPTEPSNADVTLAITWPRSKYDPSLDFDGAIISTFNSAIIPNDCNTMTWKYPETHPTIRMTATCLSYYNESIATGDEDGLVIYLEKGADANVCDKDASTKYTPILTSADWLEPAKGQRHMCYDYMDEGSPYSILAMSIGNPPCSGPEPTPAPSGVGKPFDVWYWLYAGVVAALLCLT